MKLPFAITNTLNIAKLGLFVLSKQGKTNWAITERTIRFAKDKGIVPKTIIDVGAHNSDVCKLFLDEWPDARLISFEPDLTCKPLGEVHRCALDSRTLNPTGVRFDSLQIAFQRPCLLKVDAEEFTSAAMEGFGDAMWKVDLMVVEMWNHFPGRPFKNQQFDVWKTAYKYGFTDARVVDGNLTRDGFTHYDIAFSRI